MNKLQFIIVEDEPLAREVMRDYIREVPSLELVGEFEDAIYAMEMLKTNDVDVMFLGPVIGAHGVRNEAAIGREERAVGSARVHRLEHAILVRCEIDRRDLSVSLVGIPGDQEVAAILRPILHAGEVRVSRA